jgi:hypothetical protein
VSDDSPITTHTTTVETMVLQNRDKEDEILPPDPGSSSDTTGVDVGSSVGSVYHIVNYCFIRSIFG